MKKVPSILEKKEKQTRNLKNINTEQFKTELKNKLDNMQRDINTEEMYANYIDSITSILEEHVPVSRWKCTKNQHKSWFDGKALKIKILRRKSEKTWHRNKCELHKRQYLLAGKCYKRHLYQSRKKILRDKLSSDENKTKTLYKITKILTSDTSENNFPETTSNKEVADIFANFFVHKVTKIKSGFQNNEDYNIPIRNSTSLSNFQTITQEVLIKTIKTMNSTTSPNDPCNTNFILNFSETLLPVWTNIINKSIEEGIALKCWKEAIVHQVQKNHNLGTKLANYRPISNLTFFSKLIEKNNS